MNIRSRSPRRPRRSETPPVLSTTAWGLAAFALVAGFVWLGMIAFNGVPMRSYGHAYVSVPQVGNLLKHDPVRIAGVRVGQVTSTSLGPDGRPRVRLQIEPGTKLPADTQVRMRANGLLGARYVQLLPGRSPRLLADGATIGGGRLALTFGVSDALDTLDRPTRKALGDMANGLGLGLLGRGEHLNEALRLAPHGVRDDIRLLVELGRDRGATRRLLPAVDSATTVLASARANLARLPATGADALRPFAEEQRAVRRTLEQAPSALRSARTGLHSGERLLAAVRGMAIEAKRTVPLAPGGLRATTRLLRSSHAPLRRTQRLLGAAAPAVPAVLRITRSASPLLGPLQGALDELTPMLLKIAPYGCDIENWGAVMRSMDGFGGNGEGPIGWLGEFRAQAAVVGLGGSVGVDDGLGLARRVSYPPPCTYLSKVYPLGEAGR